MSAPDLLEDAQDFQPAPGLSDASAPASSGKGAFAAPSLSGRIFRSVLVFTLAGIAAIVLVFAGIFYAAMMQLPNSAAAVADFFGGDLAVCVLAVLMVGVVVAFAISRAMTASIMHPLDRLDPADPWKYPVYAEMRPLLERIDEQQRTLRAQNKELARAENMRREFSANVSHEMKTPLQVISGYSELMANGMVPPEDVPHFAGLIQQESHVMRALINDVLTLSRLDEVPPDEAAAIPVEVLAVARRAAARLGKLAEERQVSIEVSGEAACVLGSEELMEQMVYNLVENAIRYNDEGGHVWVNVGYQFGMPSCSEGTAIVQGGAPPMVEGRPPEPRYCDRVIVSVTDDGPGVPEAKREKIFERFYRLEKSRSKETGGTGLGLAIVKHGVQRHRGTIAVGGVEGEGAQFTLSFPAYRRP